MRIVSLELGELKVRQFHDVKRFVYVVGLIHDQGGVPVHYNKVAFVIAKGASGRFIRFLPGEMINVRFLSEQGKR
jgi:hypothetical protein